MDPLPLPNAGQVLGGKYTIGRTLGEGGMGVVYEARHEKLGQRCAVKLLRPEICRDSEAVARFEREARSAASLSSRHVCRVLDVGAREDGSPFMVMEYLEGADLGHVLEQRGPLPMHEVARYLLEACEAMEEAHARGIVHRDLKPENLFLASDGERSSVKVLDFGISKRAEDNAVNVTRTQSSLGTPLYMSPEQTRSTKHVDARTDVWSMGVILYELLTGEVPFKGETPGQVAVAVAVDKYPPLLSYRADLPPEVEAVVATALAKDPDDRFPDIRSFARALTPFARGIDVSRWLRDGPLSTPGARPSGPGASVGAQALETATTLHVRARPRRQRAWLWGGAFALSIALVVALFAASSGDGPRGATGSATSAPAVPNPAGSTPSRPDPPAVVPTPATARVSASASAVATLASAVPSSRALGSSKPKPSAEPKAGTAPTLTALPTRF